jgi:predicted AAA+ superfamily ATPase
LSETEEIITVTGIRRSGKSTLMLQYMKHLIAREVPKEELLYVNFEDPRFATPTLGLLLEIYDVYRDMIRPKNKPHIFLDEVQKVAEWERFARSLHERKEAYIIASGSASGLLSAEFGEILTGRHLDIHIFPLSFKEFLAFRNIQIENELDAVARRTEIRQQLMEYLEHGGFPKVALVEDAENKESLLKTYFSDIISKDVVKRYRVKEIEKLEKLAIYYISNISTLHSFNRIKKFIALSVSTIERFSRYLTNSYLFFLLRNSLIP